MQESKIVAANNPHSAGIRKLVLVGILAAMGIILHFVESLLPAIAPVPGAKLGLANIITLMALVVLGIKGGGQVLFLRIFLGSLMAGTFLTLPFYLSLSGGVMAFLGMSTGLYLGRDRFSLVGVSILGALSHNLGQLGAVAIIIGNLGVFYYLPYLALLAIPTGFVVGMGAKYSLNALPQTGRIK